MNRPRVPEPVKLMASVFAQDRELMSEVIKALSKRFGEIDFISETFPFESTSYYEKEMGTGLIRRFLSFDLVAPPHRLPDIKRHTNKIEEIFLDNRGNRMANIDPGYISLGHLILATGKGYAHRPYLRDGIYADLTLIYKGNTFHPLEWTYPDYGSAEIILLMNTLRRRYAFQLKRLKRKETC